MNNIARAERLAELFATSRYTAGRSQEFMAKALDVSKKTIQNWESGTASPSFRKAIEWFEVLDLPIYPYLMAFLHSSDIERFNPNNEVENVRRMVQVYIDELPEHQLRELLYLFSGMHGSSPLGIMELITEYLHLPLSNKLSIAAGISTAYDVAEVVEGLNNPEEVRPDGDLVRNAIEAARSAVVSGKSSYTLTEGER